jgi:hypothetical protein
LTQSGLAAGLGMKMPTETTGKVPDNPAVPGTDTQAAPSKP